MRSVQNGDELTTRARIRDAAIAVFGESGFGTGVRAIAATAGVSPALVIHHFGSKDGLRVACDDHVHASIRATKSEYLRHPTPGGLLTALADVENYAPLVAYIVRSLQDGGQLAADLFEHMVADAEAYLADGVAAGTLRPSRDPKARARYLAMVGGGGLLLFLRLHAPPGTPIDYRKALREYTEQTMLPAIEIYTEGLLTDRMTLDTMLTELAGTTTGKETP